MKRLEGICPSHSLCSLTRLCSPSARGGRHPHFVPLAVPEIDSRSCSSLSISTAAPLRHKTTLIIFSQSSKSSTLRCGFGPQKATLFGGPFGSLFPPLAAVACCAQTRRSASLCSGCRVLNFIHCKNKDFYAEWHRSLYGRSEGIRRMLQLRFAY